MADTIISREKIEEDCCQELKRNYQNLTEDWNRRYEAIIKAKEENPDDINVKIDIGDLKRDLQFYIIYKSIDYLRLELEPFDADKISESESDRLFYTSSAFNIATELLLQLNWHI